MNFVSNDIFVLVASAASLPCNNNGALNSSLSHKALESTHTSTCCSRTSFQVLWVLLTNSWALQHFIFLLVLAGCYLLTEVRLKFIPCYTCESTVTELEMLAEKGQYTLLPWAFCFCQGGQFSRNTKYNLPCKLSLSKGACSRNSKLIAIFENKTQPLAQCFWTLRIQHWKLGTWC